MTTTTDSLRQILLARNGVCTCSQAAQALGLTSRTLKHRLKGEDTTFMLERSAVRLAVAQELLFRGVPLEDVAYRVGYELTAFHRWFKQETSTSPRRWIVSALRQRLDQVEYGSSPALQPPFTPALVQGRG